jgi:hypothetical protein
LQRPTQTNRDHFQHHDSHRPHTATCDHSWQCKAQIVNQLLRLIRLMIWGRFGIFLVECVGLSGKNHPSMRLVQLEGVRSWASKAVHQDHPPVDRNFALLKGAEEIDARSALGVQEVLWACTVRPGRAINTALGCLRLQAFAPTVLMPGRGVENVNCSWDLCMLGSLVLKM